MRVKKYLLRREISPCGKDFPYPIPFPHSRPCFTILQLYEPISFEASSIKWTLYRPSDTISTMDTTLKQEVALLRSAVIGLIGEDSEGQYRPEFVRSTFAALLRKPTRRFRSPESFLKELYRIRA